MYLDIYSLLGYNRELSFFHLALSRLTVLFFLFFPYLFFLLHPRRALLSLSSFLLRLLYLSFTAIFFTAPHIIPLFAPSSTTSNHRRHSTLFSTLHFLVFRFFSLYPTHVIVPSLSLFTPDSFSFSIRLFHVASTSNSTLFRCTWRETWSRRSFSWNIFFSPLHPSCPLFYSRISIYGSLARRLFLFISFRKQRPFIEIVASLNERSTANASIGFFDVAAWDRFKARHPTITSPDLIEFQTGSSPPFLRINSCARNGSQGKEIRLRPSIRILSVSRNSKRRSSLNRGSFSSSSFF